METPNHCSNMENAEFDYENYLDDIENFFWEDFEKDLFLIRQVLSRPVATFRV